MIIGIDGNEANIENRVGIGEYAFELLVQLKRIKIKNVTFRIYLRNSPLPFLPLEDEQWKYKIFGPRRFWTQIALPINLYLERLKPNVFFTPSHYAPRFSPVPTVISLMDVSYIHFPYLFTKKDLYQLTHWTSYSVKNARKIITISRSSKDAIIKAYGINHEKVIVIYPGIKDYVELQPHIYSMEELANKYKIVSPFILFVGTIQPRKNIIRLVEAFAKLIKQEHVDKNLILVIIGKKGWQYEDILESPTRFGIKDRVLFLDFVSDEDLPLFYKNAEFFILPSLYEGFGLPILEAMKFDCPVITSNVSSMPEAGGQAALYVNPEDVDDIADKMSMLLEDKKLRQKMIEKGREHIKNFSWEKAAKETLKVLEEVANNSKK